MGEESETPNEWALWRPRFKERVDRLERMIVATNAGGTIATLSLIGTTIGAGADRVPSSFFGALLIFVFGFILAFLGRYMMVGTVLLLRPDKERDDKLIRKIDLIGSRLTMSSGLFALLGVVYGLFLIFSLTN